MTITPPPDIEQRMCVPGESAKRSHEKNSQIAIHADGIGEGVPQRNEPQPNVQAQSETERSERSGKQNDSFPCFPVFLFKYPRSSARIATTEIQ